MPLTYDQLIEIRKTAVSPGFQTLISFLQEKLDIISFSLKTPKANRDEDLHELQLWRAYSEALDYLKHIPNEINMELEKVRSDQLHQMELGLADPPRFDPKSEIWGSTNFKDPGVPLYKKW